MKPVTLKRLTWCLVVDMMAEAWDQHDPFMLATAYRIASEVA